MVGVSFSGSELIEEYLDLLYAELRMLPREARRILAEAEDHLREGMAEGLAAGLSEREAAEHAISGFGSVSAVVRAHSRRAELFPGAAVLGELAVALWRLLSAGLLAVGASGLIAALMNHTLGREYVGGQPGSAGLSAADCRYYLGIWPAAHNCGQAFMLEISSDAVSLRVAAGFAGLLMVAAYLLARRWSPLLARRWPPRNLPDGFLAIVGTTLFGTAAAGLGWLAVAGPVRGGVGGPGSYLSGAIAALAVAVIFALPLRRTLLART